MYPFTTSMYPYYNVNMTQYPNSPEIPWYKATFNYGDCLYLTYQWLHHVSNDVIVNGCHCTQVDSVNLLMSGEYIIININVHFNV